MDIYFFLKRLIGTAIAVAMLLVLSPILIVISIAIKLESEGPIIFKQKRMGYKGKPYDIWKFRSMCNNAESQGTGLYSFGNDSRITKVGKFIRKTSLDELPQLVNIVKGEVAFVGPRSPVVGSDFPDYDKCPDLLKKRFEVLPGITGLAQVVGRNELTWPEKIKYDNIYVDKVKKYGLFFDLYVLFKTVVRVGSMQDVAETEENMLKNKEFWEEIKGGKYNG